MTDLNEIMHKASADIRAMQNRIVVLEDSLLQAKNENDGLRANVAKLTIDCLHAVADLTHFKNVFEAQACVEAMKMCSEFFNVAHSQMKEKASEAVKKIVEEQQLKQRSERQVVNSGFNAEVNEELIRKTIFAKQRAENLDEFVDDEHHDEHDYTNANREAAVRNTIMDNSLDEFKEAVREVSPPTEALPVTITGNQKGSVYVQANPEWNRVQIKRYYYNELKYVPEEYKRCPKINRLTGERVVDLDVLKEQGDSIPAFLKAPVTTPRPSVLRDTVASMAHALGV